MASFDPNYNDNMNMNTSPVSVREEDYREIWKEKWQTIAGFYKLPLELDAPTRFNSDQWNTFYVRMLEEKKKGNIQLIRNGGAFQKITNWKGPHRTPETAQAVLSGKADAIDCAVQSRIFLQGFSRPSNAENSTNTIERGFGVYNIENIEYLEKLLQNLDWAKQNVIIQITKIFEFYQNFDYSQYWHYYLLQTLRTDLQMDQYTIVTFLRGKGESGHSVIVAKINNRLFLFDPQRLENEVNLIDIDYDTNPDGTCLYEQGIPKATKFEEYIKYQGYIDFELIYRFKENIEFNFEKPPEIPLEPELLLSGIKRPRNNSTIQVRKDKENIPPKKLTRGLYNSNVAQNRAPFHPGKPRQNPKSKKKQKGISKRGGKWTKKYKKSINCKKPKGFSQKQHCKYGRKKVKKQSRKIKGGHHELLVAPILVAASYIDKYRKNKKQTKKQTKK